tara:strand:+ start:2502 stop:2687 length:186 start_codon:yes stop_codon:yes gene_type:complete
MGLNKSYATIIDKEDPIIEMYKNYIHVLSEIDADISHIHQTASTLVLSNVLNKIWFQLKKS